MRLNQVNGAVAWDLAHKTVIDLTASCSKERFRDVDDDDDDGDFCEIVAGAAGASRGASGSKPWYDLTSDTEDEDGDVIPTGDDDEVSSSSWWEVVPAGGDDGSTASTAAPAAAAAAAGAAGATPAAAPVGPAATATSAPAAAAAAAAAASVAAATAAAAALKTPQRRLPGQNDAAAAGPSNAAARAGPDTTCPGCLVDNEASVQQYIMEVAKFQLRANESVARMAPPDPGRDPRAAVLTGGQRCCADCRRLAALAVVEAAQKQVQAIVRVHRKANIQMMQGFVFEVHHAASFNIAAIRAGSLLRAECMEFCFADVRVYNVTEPQATLAMAQLKASRRRATLNKKLGQAKYAELLKVVPAGLEAPGRSSVLSFGGISSSPISLEALQCAVLMPGDHFFDLAWAA